MANIELHKFDQNLITKLKEVGYQSCCLRNMEDDIIVSYNTPKTTIAKKWDEIKKRLPALQPGAYKLLCMAKHGAKQKADVYYIKNGNFNEKEFLSEPIVVKQPVAEKKESDNVLSYSEALKKVEELAELKAENKRLTGEVSELKNKIKELEEELEDMEEVEPLEEPTKWGLQDFLASAMPALDKYFELQEKKLGLQEKRLSQRIPQPQRRVRPQPQPTQFEYPDINDEAQVEAFIDELDKLSESDLGKAMFVIQQERPDLFAICEAELFGGEEEEEQEQK